MNCCWNINRRTRRFFFYHLLGHDSKATTTRWIVRGLSVEAALPRDTADPADQVFQSATSELGRSREKTDPASGFTGLLIWSLQCCAQVNGSVYFLLFEDEQGCSRSEMKRGWGEFLHPYTLHSHASHRPLLSTLPHSLILLHPSIFPSLSCPHLHLPLQIYHSRTSLPSGKFSGPCHRAQGATVLRGGESDA